VIGRRLVGKEVGLEGLGMAVRSESKISGGAPVSSRA
jgi:hypothetical protein